MPPLMPPVISKTDRAKHAKREAERPKPCDAQQAVYEATAKVQRLIIEFTVAATPAVADINAALWALRHAKQELAREEAAGPKGTL